MRPSAWLRGGVLATAALSACAPEPALRSVDVWTGRSVSLERRPIPEGRRVSGIYLSPQLGVLRLVEREGAIVGTYSSRSCGCVVQGRFDGALQENQASYTFTERVSHCAARGRRGGRGFLFYTAPPELGRAPQLFGERDYLVEGEESPNGVARRESRWVSPWTAIAAQSTPAENDAERCP